MPSIEYRDNQPDLLTSFLDSVALFSSVSNFIHRGGIINENGTFRAGNGGSRRGGGWGGATYREAGRTAGEIWRRGGARWFWVWMAGLPVQCREPEGAAALFFLPPKDLEVWELERLEEIASLKYL